MYQRLTALMLIATLTLGMGACSWQTTVSDILVELPSIAQAVIVILQYAGVQVPAGTQAKVAKDAGAAEGLVKDLTSAVGSASPSVECELQAALAVVQTDMADLFTLGNVSNPNSAEVITGLAATVIAGIDSLLTLIPSGVTCSVPATNVMKAKLAGKYTSNGVQYKSVNRFLGDFNHAMTVKTADPILNKLAKKNQVHRNIWPVRMATVGVLQ